MKSITNTILKVILVYISLFVSKQSLQKDKPFCTKRTITEYLIKNISDEDNSIDALSFNVWGLPIWIPGQNQTDRFKKIADSILVRDFELICLQEVFHKRVRAELVQTLLPHYFHASDYECNKSIVGSLIQKDCNGGLMTISKYPIMEETFYQFANTEQTSFIEKIGGKGLLFTTILWKGQPINIINTHLCAGTTQKAASNRMNQILEMQQILDGIESYHLYPTLLFGDLNITHPNLKHDEGNFNSCHAYDFITKTMDFEDTVTELNEDSYTINAQINSFCSIRETKQKLDYIMVHTLPDSECQIWLTEQKIDFKGKSALSDHMGWKAKINIAPKIDVPAENNGIYQAGAKSVF